jgi:prepilin-type N-terminal cleavage/methylation domain-containing protein
VASGSLNYNSQGYTLIEMIATLVLVGIIVGFAVPSFLSLNKPLRDGAVQFKTQLSLMRSKAISSNQAYRLRPNPDPNPDGTREFIAEYAANCRVTAVGVVGGVIGWQRASQFDLDLPKDINLTDTPIAPATIATMNEGVCFDNRGIIPTTSATIIIKDFRGDNRARMAAINVTKLGGVDIATYDATSSLIPPDSANNPVF